MTDTTKANRIETVMVTMSDEILDCVSFATKEAADAYKRGVRNWAVQRGVIVRVFSQVMDIEDKATLRNQQALALAS